MAQLDICKCLDCSHREGIGPGGGNPSICRGWLQILLDDAICLSAEFCRQTEMIKEVLACYCYRPTKCVNKDDMRTWTEVTNQKWHTLGFLSSICAEFVSGWQILNLKTQQPTVH